MYSGAFLLSALIEMSLACLTESRIEDLLSRLSQRRVAVVGDVMLDRYYRGNASRLSPEAPVPVVEIEDESEHPGGAANVAYNLATLGANTTLFGVVGDDSSGEHLRSLLERLGIDGSGLMPDKSRPTTVKTRVIADGQHIVRADREVKAVVGQDVQKRLLLELEQRMPELDAIILQDYNKGVFSPELIAPLVALANDHGVETYVDPKFENFYAFKGVTLFKPNRKETEDALRMPLVSSEDKMAAAEALLTKLSSQFVVLTLGSEGMLLAGRDLPPALISTRAIQVADVSGAGDTVIATLAAMRAAGATVQEAVELANYAAGIVCGQVGTVPIHRNELASTLLNLHL